MKKILCTVLAAALTLSLSVSACAKGLSGTVSTNGSTSMEKVVGILSEQFMEDNDHRCPGRHRHHRQCGLPCG